MKCSPHIENILSTLPTQSGVYRFFDKDGIIIYVGKAKNLKNRVSSYFNKEHSHRKLCALVKTIVDISYTIVDTESDALLLENSLIKQYQPKYNILLKDDKTYPWLCITNENFPRLFPTRRKLYGDAKYFGPYPSGKTLHHLLDTLSELYPLRSCKLSLTKENIQAEKYRPCLDYHIKKCLGACIGAQSQEDYQNNIRQIINILEGNTHLVIRELKSKMMDFAKTMEFEKAQKVKEQIELLEQYQAKSTVLSNTLDNNVEVYGIVGDAVAAYLCYFDVVNGAIIQTRNFIIKQNLEESLEELLQMAIVEVRNGKTNKAKEIIVPYSLEFAIDHTKVCIPQRGEKQKLLELAMHNATNYMYEQQRQKELSNPELHRQQLLDTMQKDLQLPRPPAYIECFDNSNIQGKFPVSSMVCFRNGKPSKSEYRIFHVKTVDQADDFATMAEALTRRYGRLIEENKPLPDLIVVDGGKGQVSAAYEVLKALHLETTIPLLGIAKRLEEIYRPNDPIPLYVDKKSETQRIIQHLRDEAHRFGITHHRKLREKALLQTELTNIQGVGEQMAAKLLHVFRSVKIIKNTSEEDLAKVVGPTRAKTIYNFYHSTSL